MTSSKGALISASTLNSEDAFLSLRQTNTRPSSPAEAKNRPVGSQATPLTQFLCPCSVVLGVIVMLFVSTAQINTVLSIEQDANTLSSSPQATSNTSIVWPRNVACRGPRAAGVRPERTCVSSLPLASQLPFEDQAQHVTTLTCFDSDCTRCLAGSSSSFGRVASTRAVPTCRHKTSRQASFHPDSARRSRRPRRRRPPRGGGSGGRPSFASRAAESPLKLDWSLRAFAAPACKT